MADEKFINTDDLMVDYAEMTSYSYGNRPYWNANMAENELGTLKAPKWNLTEILHNMVAKFNSIKAGV